MITRVSRLSQSMLVSSRIRLKQLRCLLLLLLKFKARRLAVTLAAILLLPSNFWLFSVLASSGSRGAAESKRLVNAETFAADWQVLIGGENASAARDDLAKTMARRGADKDSEWVRLCDDQSDCQLRFFRQLMAVSGTRVVGRIGFDASDLQLECLHQTEGDLLCPFMYHLMVQAMSKSNKTGTGKTGFKDVQFFKYFDRTDQDPTLTKDTACSRTAATGNLIFVLWYTVLYHVTIATAGCMLHFTATTAAFVSTLKENGFLQLMFSNGLSVAVYWSVILGVTVIESVIFASIFSLSYRLHCPDFFPKSSASQLFVAFLIYCCGLASLSLLATVLLTSYHLVVVMTVAEILVIVAITVVSVSRLSQFPDSADLLTNAMLIFPPGHMTQYTLYVLHPDKRLPWPTSCVNYFRRVFTALAVFPAVVTLVTVYLNFVLASGSGLTLPWLFVFSRSFWWPEVTKVTLLEEEEEVHGQANFEQVSGVPEICIRDISLTYRSSCCTGSQQVQALKGISCTIYQDQITALIGHNGAGKTTLLRVLTGEESPTSGLAVITGRAVTDPYQRLGLRRHVSICKQADVLSPHLTVMESIELAALSKGFELSSQRASIDSMMERLDLSGKEDVRAMDLSGGQMRKVCCIIALIGDPRVVLLDEPTSGLDPVSRRRLWAILQDCKPGRCIILCTQFMDEADILADRKLFMSGGKLICAGSSLFLKHLFGCSSIINVSLKSEAGAASVIAGMPPQVRLVHQSKTELQLRLSASQPNVLADAVQKLESLHGVVEAFGVSQASLDDIFMRLESVDAANVESAIESGQLIGLVSGQVETGAAASPIVESALGRRASADRGSPACGRTFVALMAMNLRRQARSRVHCLCRFVMPAVLIVMVGLVVHLEKGQFSDQQLLVRRLTETGGQMSEEGQLEAAYRLQITEAVRLPLALALSVSSTVCVSDQEDPGRMDAKSCGRLMRIAGGAVSLTKPRSESLESYLASNDTVRAMLRAMCYPWCSVVHSSWWSSNQSYNDYRSISIGLYLQRSLFSATLNPYLNNFVNLAKHFGQAAAHSPAIRVSTIIGFEAFYCFHKELFVFLVLYSILPVTFMMDTVEDRATRVRQQMHVMGLRRAVYWATTFAVHWTQYATGILLCMLVFLQWDRYRNVFVLCGIGLPLLLLGSLSNLLSVYCIGVFQRAPSHSISASHFFFVTFTCSVTTFVMKSRAVSAAFVWLVPPLAPVMLAATGLKVASYASLYYERGSNGDDATPELWRAYLAYPDTRHALAAMAVHAVLQAGLLALVENWTRLSQRLQTAAASATSPTGSVDGGVDAGAATDDEGVRQEASRVRQWPRSDANLLEVRDLQRTHPNGVRAVRGVTFGAAAGEILGLLGQNGAGKTSLMSVVVGEEAATEGCVEVRHRDSWMSGLQGASRGAIGYCPQHNPMFDEITVAEHLRFYARIRGLPSRQATAQIGELVDGLGLTPCRDRRSRQLSGGNRRRLCLAVALLDSPSILVIDEASTGVDPENKRAIWGAIRGLTGGGHRSVLITTHSMEEVEALCSRVGIMNRGLLIGFGTVQQIRSRYGDAYTLEVLFATSIPSDNLLLASRKRALTAEMSQKFPHSELLEDICACCQYRLPTKSIGRLSDSIRWVASNQARLGVQYFSLHQMSLDQVFVNMMRHHLLLESGEQNGIG